MRHFKGLERIAHSRQIAADRARDSALDQEAAQHFFCNGEGIASNRNRRGVVLMMNHLSDRGSCRAEKLCPRRRPRGCQTDAYAVEKCTHRIGQAKVRPSHNLAGQSPEHPEAATSRRGKYAQNSCL